jgi:nitrite reductase/ring-hydroxylating ferredoxin subunit
MLSAADHPIVGRWTYRSGSFTDVHIYHADGRVTAPGNSEAHANWYVEGGEVVSYWHNKWYNRFRLPVAGGRISGVAIDPSGARSNISLTRAGDIVETTVAASSPANHPIVGRWTYRSGNFTDVHSYHADGRVTAPGNSEAHANWYVEGGEVVSYWHNKWYNRFRLPVAGGRISGVAIDPSGARSNISLTRAGDIVETTVAASSPANHPIVGRWTYRSGNFTDVHIYHADGRVTAPGNSEASAKWYVEGGEVVSYWHNKWYNRFRLPVAGGRISGVAIDPSGARSNISLTRAE